MGYVGADRKWGRVEVFAFDAFGESGGLVCGGGLGGDVFTVLSRRARKAGVSFDAKQRVCVVIRDLYFAKNFAGEGFSGFERAAEMLAPFGEIKQRLNECNDRDNERSLSLVVSEKAETMRLYEYKGMICFAIGGAVATDIGSICNGQFPCKPLRWNVEIERFVAFLSAIEVLFADVGDTFQCRACIEVCFAGRKLPYVIRVRTLYESIAMRDMMLRFGEGVDTKIEDVGQQASLAPPLSECVIEHFV